MNDLNSVLLGGVVHTTPVTKGNECRFDIGSRRASKADDGHWELTPHLFTILTKDRLAKTCQRDIRKGRKVRVVGTLVLDEDGGVDILADHVEYRPSSKEPKNDSA